MLERNAPLISQREFVPSAVPVRNLVKDLGMVVEMGEELGLSLPLTNQAHSINRRAADKGLALHDITAVCRLLERQGPEHP
ncbi:MAG: NAD-binding protein [Acidobacteriota bacterium]